MFTGVRKWFGGTERNVARSERIADQALVSVYAASELDALRLELRGLGFTEVRATPVSAVGWLPASVLPRLANLGTVKFWKPIPGGR